MKQAVQKKLQQAVSAQVPLELRRVASTFLSPFLSHLSPPAQAIPVVRAKALDFWENGQGTKRTKHAKLAGSYQQESAVPS